MGPGVRPIAAPPRAMNRLIKVAGVLLVVGGVAIGGLATGAFDSVAANRDVAADVAGESAAYLAIEDVYAGGTVRRVCVGGGPGGCGNSVDQAETAGRLENRYNASFDTVELAVVAVENAANDTLEVRNAPGQLAVGATGEFDLGCNEGASANAQGDVTVAVTVAGSASTPAVRIDTRTVIENVDYRCQTLG